MKTCKKCMKNKPTSEFNKGARYKDRLHPWCKGCMKVYSRKWYTDNKETVNARALEWAKANPEKMVEADRRWKAKNKEKTSAGYKAWRLKNLEYDSHRVALRKAKKKRATPVWADELKIRRVYEQAMMATEKTGTPHHVDHIVPLEHPLVCGLHWEGNIQVLPARLNIRKKNHYWPDMPKPVTRIENAQRQQRLFA